MELQICPHSVHYYGKCKYVYHTWILWACKYWAFWDILGDVSSYLAILQVLPQQGTQISPTETLSVKKHMAPTS